MSLDKHVIKRSNQKHKCAVVHSHYNFHSHYELTSHTKDLLIQPYAQYSTYNGRQIEADSLVHGQILVYNPNVGCCFHGYFFAKEKTV